MHRPTTPPDMEIQWTPATREDATELSVIFNEIAAHDDTPERLSSESMAYELEAYFAPLEEKTTTARDTAGAIVGYGTVFHRPSPAAEQRAYFNVYVAPTWRDRGLEELLIDWAIATGIGVLKDLVADRKYLCAWIYKKQEATARRFAGRDFEPVRHWWEMESLLAEEIAEVAQDGFAVVPWEDRHSEPARLVYNSAFADHWGSTPMDEANWTKLVVSSPNYRQDYSFVAVVNDAVVGYAANEVYPEDWEAAGRSEAWISGLGVVREWRKRGIATALLARSMQAMKDDGVEAAMIGVDSASSTGAQHLYQSVGFATRITGTTWQREVG